MCRPALVRPFLVLALVGLAVATGEASAAGPATPALTAPCLPPGVDAKFFFWPVVALRPLTIPTDSGDPAVAAWVLYRHGDAGIAVIWARDHLLAVDPSPDTDDPEWVDGALVDDSGQALALRSKPEGQCRWHRYKEPSERI